VGLPLVPGGPEPIGTADLVATVLQLLTVVGLVAWTDGLGTRGSAGRRPPAGHGLGRSLASGGLIVALAVIALSSSIAVADAATGHGHAPGVAADDHDHGAPIAP
jgi:hypothetical protein